MRLKPLGIAALLVFGMASLASADTPSVDVSQLPVDLSRIHRQLQQTTTEREHKQAR